MAAEPSPPGEGADLAQNVLACPLARCNALALSQEAWGASASPGRKVTHVSAGLPGRRAYEWRRLA